MSIQISKKRVAVLFSGFGSNLQALIDACEADNYPAQIVLVISNKPDAYGLERAKKAGIKNISINHKNFSSREEFDAKLTLELEKEKVDIICLAGFMRLLTAIFINRWQGKIINIHPSLLPAFKGVDAIKQAFDYGVKITGVSVHYVVQEMDSGEIILQKPIAIGSRETLEQLEKKVHKLEHSLYPKALLLVIKKIL
jgi:phosphoribosylglycinamide formyltransferase-1